MKQSEFDLWLAEKEECGGELTEYDLWLALNEADMKDLWDSIGAVEKHEIGGTFDDSLNFAAFCKDQFDNADIKEQESVITCKDCGEECTTPLQREYESCSTHIDAETYSLRN